MNNDSLRHQHCHGSHLRCISWTAILLGALFGIGASFLLNLLGASVGLSAFTNTNDGVTALAVGGFIALVIASGLSMFLCGWIAGYLGGAHCYKRAMGELYGFAAWCLALILMVLLAAPVTKFVDSYTHTVNPYTTSVDFTSDRNAPLATEQTRGGSTNVKVNTEKAVNTFGVVGFAVFF
jgi:hypothetical protein